MRPGVKLFVGNVPEEATAEELGELFTGVAGPVLGVALMKQFAFVHLRDEAAAARAIAQLNGHQLHGRRIVVEPSRPRPTNTCKIFVGNVSAACTSGELRALFQQYGPVVECDVVKAPQYQPVVEYDVLKGTDPQLPWDRDFPLLMECNVVTRTDS